MSSLSFKVGAYKSESWPGPYCLRKLHLSEAENLSTHLLIRKGPGGFLNPEGLKKLSLPVLSSPMKAAT